MPSGARKRKAAKKKQEKLPPTTSSTSSTQGVEDLKHHKSYGDHNTDGEREKATGQDDGGQKKGDSSSSSSSSDSDDGSQEVEKEVMIVENAPVIDLLEAPASVAEGPASVAEGPIEVTHTTLVTKLDDPLVESVPEVAQDNIPILDKHVLVESRVSADSSISPDVVKLGQTENGVAKMSSAEGSARLAGVSKDLAPEDPKDEENASLPGVAKELSPDEKNKIIDVAETSEATVNNTKENVMLSYNAPRVDSTEDVKESEVLGSVDSQACVASAVRADQATSLKSCCGLFEAFAGTSR